MTLGNVCSRQFCMGGVGFLLVISGLMFGMFWTEIFTYMFGKEAALTPTSKTYDAWKTPPFPLSFDIYFFNWTNPEDLSNHSTKPILQQLGPYRFTERPDKVDIVFHPENHTVSYRRKSDFWFDEEGSVGSLDDEVTILNAVAISAAAKSKYWGFLRQKGVDVGLTIYNQPLAVTKTVDELLFTGYEDDMITIARDMPSFFGDDVEVPFDRFGWFYTRNGSADLTGTYNVFTGTDDIQKIGKIYEWNYKTHSGFFKDQCGQINGSAGEFYPPNLQDVDTISMFSADLCRSMDFDYEKSEEIDGILGYKYAAGARSVDNGTLYPENKCFCGDQCVPSGVMNISSCRFGTPVFMSYPHFYGADEFYVNQVEGLDPQKSKHEFYMTLEPNTGVPLEVAARLQVNMLVEEFPNIGWVFTFAKLITNNQRLKPPLTYH
ncbi:hypothetical protein ACFFRR_003939 [Megaselia abdita]